MICSKCGANVPEGNAFCMMCGTPLKQQEESWFHSAMGVPSVKTEDAETPYIPIQKPICPHCGTLLEEDSHFCHRCGNRASNKPFCPHCAATLRADSLFCHRCGKSIQIPSEPTAAPKDRKKLFVILGSAAAALLLVIGIWMIWLSSGRTAEETAMQSVDASFTGDLDAFVELIPEEALQLIAESAGYDEDEFLEDLEESFEYREKIYNQLYGEDWTYSRRIIDTDELSGKELREIKEIYEEEFDLRVKEAVIVEVEYTIGGGSREHTDVFTSEITLIKIGRQWYVEILSTNVMF